MVAPGRHTIELGDRIIRTGRSRTVYAIAAWVELPGLPIHARLQPEGEGGEDAILVSVTALTDVNLYRRIP
ncbi:MAG: hypothetical protein P4M00_17120 [Azospirillaceae bacterium]|nr:hypothetical protein [Azospirillaceae bacterium]